jgi:hypothetical protein
MILKLLALCALTVTAGVGLAQGPPPGFRNPQEPQPAQPIPASPGEEGRATDRGPVIVEKRCSKCNRVVSSTSKPGDTCPFCGTKWGDDEGDKSKPKAAKSPKPVDLHPERTEIEKTIGRYAIVIAGLAVSALVVTLTVRFIMNNI